MALGTVLQSQHFLSVYFTNWNYKNNLHRELTQFQKALFCCFSDFTPPLLFPFHLSFLFPFIFLFPFLGHVRQSLRTFPWLHYRKQKCRGRCNDKQFTIINSHKAKWLICCQIGWLLELCLNSVLYRAWKILLLLFHSICSKTQSLLSVLHQMLGLHIVLYIKALLNKWN